MLALGGYHIELFKWLVPEGKATGIRQCDLGLTHICFQVSDAEEVRRRILAAGYEPLSEVQSLRGGRAKPFYCRGPEGMIVEFVEYPNHRSRSVDINNHAMPILVHEAITAQNSKVDAVSGATDTSEAFVESLHTALQQALS